MGAGRPSSKYKVESEENNGLRWTDNLRKRSHVIDRLDRLFSMDGRTRHNTGNQENSDLEMQDRERVICWMFILEDMEKNSTNLEKLWQIQEALAELEEVLIKTNDFEGML